MDGELHLEMTFVKDSVYSERSYWSPMAKSHSYHPTV